MSGWVFDLGNTRLKLAQFDADGRLGAMAAVAHDGTRFEDGWQSVLPPALSAAWIACVGPHVLRAQLSDALAARGAQVSFASSLPRFAGITVAYADPQRLGVDRLLAMAAARARHPAPVLVVGVGTALTLDLVDVDGIHRGGRIAPSPALMREALQRRAPQLPLDGGGYVEFGDDTASALASGCIGAGLGLIERSRQQAQAQLGTLPWLCLHGGGAETFFAHFDDAVHVPGLVLEGLVLWARHPRDTD